jgi:DNA-binding response OmpR family regulator
VKRVLVVEDDPHYRELITSDLAARGFGVTAVSSAEQALPLAALEKPDAIILDVGLPGMSGWQALEALRGDLATASIPVLMLTATDSPEDLIRGYSQGAAYYLSKPYRRDELIRGLHIAIP